MALKEKMFRGGLWIVAGRAAAIVGSLVLNMVLTRALPPADYGAYFVVLNTVIILGTFGLLGMDQIVVRFVPMRKSAEDDAGMRAVIGHCLRIVLVSVLVMAGAVYLLSPWFFGGMMRMPVILPLTGLVICWLIFSTVQRQLAETFRGLRDFRLSTLYGSYRNNGILLSLFGCVGALALWPLGLLNLRTAFAVSAFASLAVLIIALWSLRARLKNSRGLNESSSSQSPWSTAIALGESWPLWLANTLMLLRNQGGGWLTAMFDVPQHVALFGVAQRLILLLTAPLLIVSLLLAPVVAELHHRGELRRLERVVQVMGGLASLPCALILAVLLLGGRPLLGMLFGTYYEAAAPILIALAIGQCANVATGSWQTVLPMTGQKYQTLKISGIALLMAFVFCIAGGRYYGVLGVAVGISAAAIISNLLGMWETRKKLGIWTFVSVSPSAIKETWSMLRQLRTRRSTRATGGSANEPA